jgi:hypothetical protein
LNLQWIGDWIPKHLQLGNNKIIKETFLDSRDGEISFGTKGDDLASIVEVGVNIAVNAKFGNVEGVDFYVICCSKTLYIIKEDFKCKWGTKFLANEQVVANKYYQKWGNYGGTYVLLKDSRVVFMYSHLVRTTKFLMILKDYRVQGNDFVYEHP